MAASQAWMQMVVALYRSPANLTMKQIAARLQTRVAHVSTALQQLLPAAEYKALKAQKYAASKTGSKNPMLGKMGTEHPNWKGACPDGNGYFTILWKGKRRFVHHVVMMQALAIREIPVGMEVHHIDGDPSNNRLDNLALTTPAGHKRIHSLQAQVSPSLPAQSRLSAVIKPFMT